MKKASIYLTWWLGLLVMFVCIAVLTAGEIAAEAIKKVRKRA